MPLFDVPRVPAAGVFFPAVLRVLVIPSLVPKRKFPKSPQKKKTTRNPLGY